MYKHFFKRLIDFCIALAFLPVLVVACVPVWVAIKLDDGGPLFYRARRIGRHGRIFTMYKFRSMKVNAPDLRMADGSTFNAANDPRDTRVGRWLRRTSLDELPQLWNILVGDMALIGPRPDSAFYLPYYEPHERVILTVRPGITGYNQVVKRNAIGTKGKILNDIRYVSHLSFWFDLKIVYLTIHAVLTRKDVYRA